jgi:hypothetical protein
LGLGFVLQSGLAALYDVRMHLLIDGLVKAGERKGQGLLLMTDRSAFFLLNTGNSHVWVHFGLLGYFLGRYFARKAAKKNPPPHLFDPEIQALDEKSQLKVSTATLLVKMPIDPATAVQETRMGYQFKTNDGKEAEISSWGNKKKIARALSEKGIVANPKR